jgi:hypothetical protein
MTYDRTPQRQENPLLSEDEHIVMMALAVSYARLVVLNIVAKIFP